MVLSIARIVSPDKLPEVFRSRLKGWANLQLCRPSKSCTPFQRACATAVSVRSVHNQPLRILFCGSDELSITSLEALSQESQASPANVASIDVVCRPGKPTGRGLKQIRHPPIKHAAERLGLPVHQINTFTGWKLPTYNSDGGPYFHLIVAVSFGLLVPPRILNGTAYGGINVHPSLLPSYRGPAPLHWIILRGETHMGVTLQTLHPTEFDAGVVLDQTEEPGVPIPNPATYTYADLQSMSAAMAAEMLVKAVRERSFIPPCEDVRTARGTSITRAPSFAPKIEPRMRYIDFRTMTSSQILRMNRVMGPLWAEARSGVDRLPVSVIFDTEMHLASVVNSTANEAMMAPSIEPGLPYAFADGYNHVKARSAPIMINTIDDQTLIVPMLKMPGTTYRPAAALAQTARLLAEPSLRPDRRVRTFYEPLRVPDDIRQYLKTLWNAPENAT